MCNVSHVEVGNGCITYLVGIPHPVVTTALSLMYGARKRR